MCANYGFAPYIETRVNNNAITGFFFKCIDELPVPGVGLPIALTDFPASSYDLIRICLIKQELSVFI